ncbi:hypothetical protein CIG75_10110 [Tumebacillus algifaecis]|uniref:Bacterial transcriptional activator domain-containing protein n=1 Tax=Tumebacillus algifaecis TaxID=1214604 RepID=A0A223D0Y6_9BACL|nr:BTAD domain-containing putative transcriptional regulator [Tumebacillus algifaecis]ASS75308.1 hypothetical protein CIG75_10110 [Tumebacillus algifaecis]
MNSQPLMLTTKLVPPRVKIQCLRRKRLDELLIQVADYPVTLVQADAGYGKSTALVAHLCSQFDHIAWYSVEAGERDAFLFLNYLIHALKAIQPQIGERSLRLLEDAELSHAVLQPCLTLLINDLAEFAPDPTVLVLDDLHTVAGVPEIATVLDLLIRYLPAHLHLVIGSRRMLEIDAIKRLQATYDLLLIGKKELTFSTSEIAALFEEEYGIVLDPEQVCEIQEQTEGWIIALQMIWKGLERGMGLPELWQTQPEAGRALLTYLAEEVFDRQPPEVQVFLERTCILQTMEPDVCNLLLGRVNSAEMLRQLERSGLFVTEAGSGHYRYHRLFQKFLETHAVKKLERSEWTDLQEMAAALYEGRGDLQMAMAHYSAADKMQAVVRLLLMHGEELLANGRLELMKGWIDKLPGAVLEQYPKLLFWRGEVDRALSRFHEAEHWYTLAEGGYIQKGDALGRSYVYRGQAQVFLDTIQPVKANYWLQKAVQILGDDYPAETFQTLRLLAENHTNSGQLREAQEMIQRADALMPEQVRDELDVRLHLRTGRLKSARQMTLAIIEKEWRDASNGQHRVAKSHREMHLLLSLIDAFLGEADSSRWHAEQGIAIGQKLQSPFVEAVGFMRLGHAMVLAGRLEEAQTCYHRSVRMSEELCVERGKVEGLMGLCITTGLLGELELAETYARTGLELALHVHDLWCANLLRLAQGSVLTAWGYCEEALPWLLEAEAGFAACGDQYCLAGVRLWLSMLYLRLENKAEFRQQVTELLHSVETHGFYDLFIRRTLFGPSDLQMTVPFLIEARDALGLEGAEKVLRMMGCKGAEKHPGYTLRISTLGKFVVVRGLEEVARKEWKREKSRQLFQLLVTRHGQLVQRDELYELLWPEMDEKTANRDFKVAMNALTHAIEPKREARSNCFFIERLDTAYRLDPEAAVWIDAIEFEKLAESGLQSASVDPMRAVGQLEAALLLYKGDFLQDQPYLEWCSAERERLRTMYLRALEALARLYQERGAYQDATVCCERILQSDASWEAAYQILMICYHQLGNRSMVISSYKSCVTQLSDHLGLTPMAETTKLYQRLVRGAGNSAVTSML